MSDWDTNTDPATDVLISTLRAQVDAAFCSGGARYDIQYRITALVSKYDRQSEQIVRLTKEKDRAYQSLKVIHTWAECWNYKFDPADNCMTLIAEMCCKGLGRNTPAEKENEK